MTLPPSLSDLDPEADSEPELSRLTLVVGGLNLESLGEDAELVSCIHQHLQQTKQPYRVVFASEPVCWTEVPPTARILARQRRR